MFFHGRLELGAGGGLVGLAVALGCGGENQLLLTDQDEMLELMQTNIRLNQVDSRAQALILNWYVGPFMPCWFGFVLGEERGEGFIVPLPHPQPYYVLCNVLVFCWLTCFWLVRVVGASHFRGRL